MARRTVIVLFSWLALTSAFPVFAGAPPSLLSNQTIIDDNTASLSFVSMNTRLSIRFTSRQSAPITQVRLRCHATSSAGSSPLFAVELRADAAGNPGAIVGSSGSFNWTPGTWAVLPLVPTPPLTAGLVYHIVIVPVAGPGPDPNNNRTLATYQPFQQLQPFDQTTDVNFLMLSSLDGGLSYGAQGMTPAWIAEFDNGEVQGNPYYNPIIGAVHGNGDPPTSAGNDDPAYGEEFPGPSVNTPVAGVGLYASRGAGLVPTDDLFYFLYNLTDGVVVDTGPVAFARQLASGIPQWLFADFPVSRNLLTGKTYRLYFKSPGSRTSRAPIVHGISFNELTTPYVDAAFGGLPYRGGSSLDGGSSFTFQDNADLSYQIRTVASSISTPTPVTPGQYFGNQASITSNTAGSTITSNMQRVSIRFTALTGGNLSQFHFHTFLAGNPGSFQLELRADDFGDPGALLATSNSFTPVVGFTATAFPSLPLLSANTVYHAVFVPLGSPSVGNSITPIGTLPHHKFVPSHKVFDYNANYLFFNGLAWIQRNAQPVYLLEYQVAPGTLEGNPYDSWTFANIHGNNTPLDHGDDALGSEAVAGSAPNLNFNTLEAFVEMQGTPGNLYYQILRTDIGNEQILDSGRFLTPAQYLGPAWYKVNLSAPIALAGGPNYRFQFYCHTGNATNYWTFRSPACSSGNAARQGASFGPAAVLAMSSTGQAGIFNVDNSADIPFRLNIQGSTAAVAPTPTITRTPSRTPTPTITPTFSPTLTPTITPTFTPSATATFTSTATPSNTPSNTSSFTPSFTPSFTSTFTPSYTSTDTPSNTPTNTASFTATFTQSPTPSITFTPSPTSSFTFTPTSMIATPIGSATATPTATPSELLTLDLNFFNPDQQTLGMDLKVTVPGQVKVAVFNIVGEQVVKLSDQSMAAGNYRIVWDGKNKDGSTVGNAVYFILAQTPDGNAVRKVIVLK